MSLLRDGFGKLPSMSLTSAVPDRDGIDWVNSIWKGLESRVITFRHTCGLVYFRQTPPTTTQKHTCLLHRLNRRTNS